MQSAWTGVPSCRSVLALLIVTTAARAGEQREIRGSVVDEAGTPVAAAAVGYFWRANGSGLDRDGKPLDLTKEENVKIFWDHLGEMEPAGTQVVKTGLDGRFSLKMPGIYYALMAMDPSRRRGGLVVPPKEDVDETVEIRLGPLVRVHGSFEGPGSGQRPAWTHAYFNLPEDPTRPLDSTHFVSCGSFDAKFEVRLPPGRYVLKGYSQFADKDLFEGELVPDREVVLKGDTFDVDLGRLIFSPHRVQKRARKAQAQADGMWGDYTKHYGEKPPRWHITDSRGVSKDAQLSNFQGKWLLVEFWNFGCTVCLRTGLPRLMKFYEEHSADRDRFEILAVCLDPDGDLKSMADVDRQLEPIVKHVWGGKSMPFPVLLDSTFQTWERYGLPGVGMVLLVDPQGNLVKGDEAVLAEKLKEREIR
jgi:AhpC/TSA family